MIRYPSKKSLGRVLLGKTWDELPVPHSSQELRAMRVEDERGAA
jgi:protein gp37